MSTAQTDGRLQLWQIGVTSGLTGIWGVIGAGLFAGAGLIAVSVGTALHPDWRSLNPSFVVVSILVSIPLTLVAHEAIHGLTFRIFGGRPRFGAGIKMAMPYLYAACPDKRFERDRFLVVGLAPLIVLNVIALVLMVPAATAVLGAGVLVFNTSGAVGDLWVVGLLLQAPRWVEIEDTGPIFIASAPVQHALEAAGLRPPLGLDPPSGRWIAVWYMVSLAVVVVGAAVLGALTRAGGQVWLGPIFLASRHELNIIGGLFVAAAIAVPLTVLIAAVWRAVRRS